MWLFTQYATEKECLKQKSNFATFKFFPQLCVLQFESSQNQKNARSAARSQQLRNTATDSKKLPFFFKLFCITQLLFALSLSSKCFPQMCVLQFESSLNHKNTRSAAGSQRLRNTATDREKLQFFVTVLHHTTSFWNFTLFKMFSTDVRSAV